MPTCVRNSMAAAIARLGVGAATILGCGDDSGVPAHVDDASAPAHEATDATIATPSADAGPLPADVRKVVYAHCVSCHGELPLFGAPMKLTRAGDFHAPAHSDAQRPVSALVLERVRDDSRPMPPRPYAALDDAEVATLRAWIDAGARPGEHDAGDAGAGVAGPRTDVSSVPVDGCDLVLDLRAHGEPRPNDTTPFALEGPVERSECFVFRSPWDMPAHALWFEPLIDDETIVHHVSLGAVEAPTEYTVDGKITPCAGNQEPIAYALAFWLPGAGVTAMPDAVGLRLPGGADAHYVLQVHYSVRAGRHEDRSGFRICATHALRPNEAELHWFGSERIAVPAGERASVTSDCSVRGEEPVRVVSLMPHMHQIGLRMRFERVTAMGATHLLQDEPFQFQEQRVYPVDWALGPGEALRTTCEYENTTGAPVTFGQLGTDEMCYAFAFVYPGGRLSDRPAGDLQHGCVAR
jgi:hypothetical protein